jgi:FtsP/CotA-like multicopper oxidase with cupredoxin domain
MPGADDYGSNPRKHTVIVQPAELLTVDITADAPGQWAFHCHLLYHMEMGMFRTVAVVRSSEGGPLNVKAQSLAARR